MTGMQGNPAARYGVAGLLAGLALATVLGSGRVPPAHAQPASSPEQSGVLAFTTGAPGSPQLLYLVDTREQAFAVYQVDPQAPQGAIKLEGTRQYRWDLKLSEFNNQEPNVVAVQSMVGTVPRR